MVVAPVGAYTQREQYLQKQEEEGELSFEYVRNNGETHNSIWCAPLPACRLAAPPFKRATISTCQTS